MVGNGGQQAHEVLVHRVVVLDEGFEAAVQVGADLRRVVPPQRRVADLERVVVVVGEAGELLENELSASFLFIEFRCDGGGRVFTCLWPLDGLALACEPAYGLDVEC